MRGVAPHRGEHNHAVLQDWLDLSAADVQALYAEGVLLQDRDDGLHLTPSGLAEQRSLDPR